MQIYIYMHLIVYITDFPHIHMQYSYIYILCYRKENNLKRLQNISPTSCLLSISICTMKANCRYWVRSCCCFCCCVRMRNYCTQYVIKHNCIVLKRTRAENVLLVRSKCIIKHKCTHTHIHTITHTDTLWHTPTQSLN